MKKIDFGQTVTVLTNIAVIAGIAFLAIEIRQNTNAQLATSRQTLLASDLGLLSMGVDFPEAVTGLGTLGDSPDEVRKTAWLISFLRIREFAWFQFQNGVLDQTTWESYVAPATLVFESQESRAVLGRFNGDPEFIAYMEDLLEHGSASPWFAASEVTATGQERTFQP